MLENEIKSINAAITSIAGFMKQQQKGDILESIRQSLNEVVQHPVTVLVCGEFKRGKSTFINALIGRMICPTDVDICTSIVTIIKYGAKEKATRLYGDFSNLKSQEIGFEDIERYTVGTAAEIDNTVCMELELPLEKLKAGLIIIDTPGVGGLDPRHALLTNYFMPRADIALFMTDVNEPLTTTELSFYKDVVLRNAQCSAIIVNKSDLKDAKSVEEIRQDSISKVSAYTQCSRENIRAIAVSSADCIREESGMGNFSEVYKLINALILDYKGSMVKCLRDDLIAQISMMVAMLKQQIAQYENPDMHAVEKLLKQKQELDDTINSLTDFNSPFRQEVASSIAKEREAVTKYLNEASSYITNNVLSKLVTDKNAMNDNGGEWVGRRLGDEIMSLENEITKKLNQAFTRITEMKEFAGLLDFKVSKSDTALYVENVDLSIPYRKHFMSSFSGLSSVFVAASFIGGTIISAVAAPLALYFAYDSHKESVQTIKQTKLKQVYLPKLQTSIQNLRTHTESRFNEFQREWIRVVTERVKDVRNTTSHTVVEIQRIQQEIKNGVNKKVALQNQVKSLENIQAQLENLNL